MGSVSFDISIKGLWNSWLRFQRGKRKTQEFFEFAFDLEKNLFALERELASRTYVHGPYRTFVVSEGKRRIIAVASIRDRVAHRLLYDYLVFCFDGTFMYDAWSCRRGKGLLSAIERVEQCMRGFPRGYVWRADIRKFFESVPHDRLLSLLPRRVHDSNALWIAKEIVGGGAS